MVQSDLYEKLVKQYGKDHQLQVMVEEMGEAITAISQRQNRGRGTEDDMIEEIADVVIMTEQMRVIFGDKLIQAVLKKMDKAATHLE